MDRRDPPPVLYNYCSCAASVTSKSVFRPAFRAKLSLSLSLSMEKNPRLGSDRKEFRNPPPRRGQVKARIFRSISQSVADMASRAASAIAGGSAVNSPATSASPSAYSSDYSVDA